MVLSTPKIIAISNNLKKTSKKYHSACKINKNSLKITWRIKLDKIKQEYDTLSLVEQSMFSIIEKRCLDLGIFLKNNKPVVKNKNNKPVVKDKNKVNLEKLESKNSIETMIENIIKGREPEEPEEPERKYQDDNNDNNEDEKLANLFYFEDLQREKERNAKLAVTEKECQNTKSLQIKEFQIERKELYLEISDIQEQKLNLEVRLKEFDETIKQLIKSNKKLLKEKDANYKSCKDDLVEMTQRNEKLFTETIYSNSVIKEITLDANNREIACKKIADDRDIKLSKTYAEINKLRSELTLLEELEKVNKGELGISRELKQKFNKTKKVNVELNQKIREMENQYDQEDYKFEKLQQKIKESENSILSEKNKNRILSKELAKVTGDCDELLDDRYDKLIDTLTLVVTEYFEEEDQEDVMNQISNNLLK
jgi:hypothetical protein